MSPIETGKQLHEHNKAPHEPAPPTDGDRHSRIVQIGEALLLALVTIAAPWLDDPGKQAVAARRFRPEFKVAFDAWMATDPLDNPRAAPEPTYMPEYRLVEQARADELDREAEEALAAGTHAGLVSDEYIRITVFFAAVLVMVGIGSTFKLHTVRYVLISVGAVLLIFATVLIARQPGIPA